NAGYTLIGSLEETAIEEAKQLFETNFLGVLRMTKAVLRFMRDQRSGRIVNIGWLVGFVPAPYQGIYCASKHALEGYSESLDQAYYKCNNWTGGQCAADGSGTRPYGRCNPKGDACDTVHLINSPVTDGSWPRYGLLTLFPLTQK